MSTLANNLAQIKAGTLFAGLVLGLDNLTAVVLDAGGRARHASIAGRGQRSGILYVWMSP